jgi:hypothetical protein
VHAILLVSRDTPTGSGIAVINSRRKSTKTRFAGFPEDTDPTRQRDPL